MVVVVLSETGDYLKLSPAFLQAAAANPGTTANLRSTAKRQASGRSSFPFPPPLLLAHRRKVITNKHTRSLATESNTTPRGHTTLKTDTHLLLLLPTLHATQEATPTSQESPAADLRVAIATESPRQRPATPRPTSSETNYLRSPETTC